MLLCKHKLVYWNVHEWMKWHKHTHAALTLPIVSNIPMMSNEEYPIIFIRYFYSNICFVYAWNISSWLRVCIYILNPNKKYQSFRWYTPESPSINWITSIQAIDCRLSAPGHYMNRFSFISNWTIKVKLQWNRSTHAVISIQENVWKMSAILMKTQCVKTPLRFRPM